MSGHNGGALLRRVGKGANQAAEAPPPELGQRLSSAAALGYSAFLAYSSGSIFPVGSKFFARFHASLSSARCFPAHS